MSILDFFASEKKTVNYIPVSSWSVNASTGQSTDTAGTPVSLTGLFWDRSEAARYFGQQISSDVSSYFVPDDASYFYNTDGTIKKTGSITYSGNDYDIETVQNVGEQGEV